MNSLKHYATEHIFSADDLIRCARRLTSDEISSEVSTRAVKGIIGISSNFGLNLFNTVDKVYEVYEFCKNSKK